MTRYNCLMIVLIGFCFGVLLLATGTILTTPEQKGNALLAGLVAACVALTFLDITTTISTGLENFYNPPRQVSDNPERDGYIHARRWSRPFTPEQERRLDELFPKETKNT